jgi:hypothetical protein
VGAGLRCTFGKASRNQRRCPSKRRTWMTGLWHSRGRRRRRMPHMTCPLCQKRRITRPHAGYATNYQSSAASRKSLHHPGAWTTGKLWLVGARGDAVARRRAAGEIVPPRKKREVPVDGRAGGACPCSGLSETCEPSAGYFWSAGAPMTSSLPRERHQCTSSS